MIEFFIALVKASVAVLVVVGCFTSSYILLKGFLSFYKVNKEVDRAIKTGNFHIVKEEKEEKKDEEKGGLSS